MTVCFHSAILEAAPYSELPYAFTASALLLPLAANEAASVSVV